MQSQPKLVMYVFHVLEGSVSQSWKSPRLKQTMRRNMEKKSVYPVYNIYP